MDAFDFTNNQLKDLLRQLNLNVSGSKSELISKLDVAVTRQKWLAMIQKKIAEDPSTVMESVEDPLPVMEVGASSDPEVTNHQACPPQNEPAFLVRELEFMRRENELMRRELDLARRETEILRSTPRSEVSARTSNVTLKSIGDYLCEFHGTENTFSIWEKEVRKLRTIYDLDDNSTKLLIGAKVKDKAKAWLHSKAEYIDLNVNSLLGEMKKMFDNRLGKLLQRRKFEERKWRVGEAYRGYHYDKIILGNQLSLEEDEFVEYMIDGIPDVRLRDQARMQRFSSLDHLFKAFENITLQVDGKKNNFSSTKTKLGTDRKESSSFQPVKCYNCNEEGHYSGSCPKPKRERGSCFHCGKMDHRFKDCPTAKKESKQKSSSNTNSASNTTALVEEPVRRRDTKDIIPVCEEILDRQLDRKPLIKPTREYCVLLAKEFDNQYYLEALVDSGSAISIMSKSTYSNFFSDEELTQNKVNISYGGINKSPLCILGVITSKVRLHLIPDYTFLLRFVVVPDSTMTYDILLGREFIDTPHLTVTFNRSLQMSYDKPMNDILNIEVTEQASPLDIVSDNLDASLSYAIKDELLGILHTYVCFAGEIEDIPYQFEIQLIDPNKSFYFTPRRLAWNERGEVRRIIDGLRQKGIIRPSNSNFCSPIVLVKKKNNTYRMCIDYRTLNKITVKDRYPLPLVEDQIEELSGKSYFTSLDLKDGFHHVPINESSIKFTSFVTPDGQYEYLKLPFGLANAPAAFQRCINIIFKPLLDAKKVQIYFDDVMIATSTIEENLEIVKEVLHLLARYGLELNFGKCQFLKREIEYFGYNISENGITLNELKVEAIRKFPQPQTVKQLQSFLGLTSYFRKFIANYARIAKSLYDLIKKDVPFTFGENELRAFEILQEKLTNCPVLALYNPKAPTELHTDASSYGYGAVLLQRQQDGQMHPVMYHSRRTTATESRYHSYELETLAIVYALERFRVYLQGIPFVVITDCSAVQLALSKKDVNPRISRWCMILQNYNYVIEHRSSDRMRHVDALSRNVLIIEPLSFDQILVYKQLQDCNITKIQEELEVRESDKFELRNGVVYRKRNGRIYFYVPDSMIQDVIRMCHDEIGHVGPEKTIDLINKTYWFPGMRVRVKDYISNCVKCLTYSVPTGKVEGKLHVYEKGSRPFETLHIDHYGPLEKVGHGFKYIFIVIDAFTKYTIIYPVKSTVTKEVIACLRQYFHHFGICRRIVSDRGSSLVSDEFACYLKQLNIDHIKVASATPRSNGQVERVNRFLRSILSKLSSEGKWIDFIGRSQFSLNNTLHKAIGTTPSLILFGSEQYGFTDDSLKEYFHAIQDSDIDRSVLREHAIVKTRAMQEYNKRIYDKRHKEPNVYKIGDFVMVKNVITTPGVNQKLAPKYKGPYIVDSVLDRDRYVIKDIQGFQITQRPFTGIFGPDRLKPWIKRIENPERSEHSSDDEDGRDDHNVRMPEL